MRNLTFGKLIAALVVAGLFYIGHGLHQTTSVDIPSIAQPALAADQNEEADKFVWKQVDFDGRQQTLTRRAKVPGGWLVAVRQIDTGGNGVTFVPDSQHIWDGRSLK